MGIDISDLFGKAEDAAKTGMNDLLKTGGNAAIGYLEGQAIQVISSDQSQHEQASQSAVQDVLNRPSSPFGQYVSNLMQNPVLNQYGPYIIFGVVGILLVGMYMRKG